MRVVKNYDWANNDAHLRVKKPLLDAQCASRIAIFVVVVSTCKCTSFSGHIDLFVIKFGLVGC